MRRKVHSSIIVALLIVGMQVTAFPQKISDAMKEKIKSEISAVFEKSIDAGEKLDVKKICENVNDTLMAGFIENGNYFKSFEELMVGFKSRIKGVESQKMNIDNKKITVLSKDCALLTANGNFSAKITDGRILNGKFAWTFVYSKINGEWKVIHSHM